MLQRICNQISSKGFTLVELAIVMVIIGILIGGILKGHELIVNSRIKRTMMDVKGYGAAVEIFKSKYTVLPGDMRNASTRIANCGAICDGGNGDGSIGLRGRTAILDQSGAAPPRVETTLFWKHLQAADLIRGIDTQANPADPRTGVTHPAAPIGGVFSVYNRAASPVNPEGVHGISIKACANNETGGCPGGGIFNARETAHIDLLIDGDQDPFSGLVMANVSGTGETGCDFNNGRYDVTVTAGNCYILFNLSF